MELSWAWVIDVIYILKQCLSKDKKRHKQLNINQEETKHSMFDKDNIDELYPYYS